MAVSDCHECATKARELIGSIKTCHALVQNEEVTTTKKKMKPAMHLCLHPQMQTQVHGKFSYVHGK